MFKVGDMVQGSVYNDDGEETMIVGAFMFRTEDPEEYIQDIVVRTADGRTVYIDEQDARPYKPTNQVTIGDLDGNVPNHFDQNSRNFQPK